MTRCTRHPGAGTYVYYNSNRSGATTVCKQCKKESTRASYMRRMHKPTHVPHADIEEAKRVRRIIELGDLLETCRPWEKEALKQEVERLAKTK